MTYDKTNNTTGIPYNVTKDPQCRHSEHQGFVSYTVAMAAGKTFVFAACSNCGSDGGLVSAPSAGVDLPSLKERARNQLMKIEAEPLTP